MREFSSQFLDNQPEIECNCVRGVVVKPHPLGSGLGAYNSTTNIVHVYACTLHFWHAVYISGSKTKKADSSKKVHCVVVCNNCLHILYCVCGLCRLPTTVASSDPSGA